MAKILYIPKRNKDLLQGNRNDISTLINAITGRCLLGTHARTLGTTNHDNCHSCTQVFLSSTQRKTKALAL